MSSVFIIQMTLCLFTPLLPSSPVLPVLPHSCFVKTHCRQISTWARPGRQSLTDLQLVY